MDALAMTYNGLRIEEARDTQEALDMLFVTFGREATETAILRSQTSTMSLLEAARAEYGVRHRADRARRWAATAQALKAVPADPALIYPA